ncbi:MAG: phage major capsid protein [Gaiellaceae bacterium]
MISTIRRHGHAVITASVATVREHGSNIFYHPVVQFGAAMLLALVAIAIGGFTHVASALPLIGVAGTAATDIATTIAAEVSETFKRVYLEAADAIPDATPLTAQLNRTRKFKGAPDGLYFNVKLETGGAVANVGDGGLLPRPSRPKNKTGKSTLVHTYTVVAVGGQSIPLTEDTRNAFVANLETQLEDGMTRVQNDLERQYNGDGLGILCTLSAVGAAPTYGVQKPYGQVGAGPGSMLLIEDMDVAIVDPAATGAERGRAKISAVDVDNDTMTLSAAVAGAAIGDYVVLCNDVGATGTDKVHNYGTEAAGVLAVAGAGTFENIVGGTYRRWRATSFTAATMTEKVAATLDARIRTSSGKKPSIYYTTPGIILSVQESLAGRRMSTGETLELKGGYEGLKLNNRTVLEGAWCAKGNFFALNTEKKAVGMVDVVKMGYVDLDGAKLHRIEGRHAYRADLYFAHQAIWFARNQQGRVSGLADDNTIRR